MSINYEQDIRIDENALDIEWLQQPTLMIEYSKVQASAKREVDRLKEALDLCKAELDKAIRTDPEKYDIVKPTETAIQNAILMQDEYREANAELIEARYEYEIAKGAVDAVEHRKVALENLSRLLGLQYFAGPRQPRDLSYEVQQQQQKSRSNQTVKIKRKRTKN